MPLPAAVGKHLSFKHSAARVCVCVRAVIARANAIHPGRFPHDTGGRRRLLSPLSDVTPAAAAGV